MFWLSFRHGKTKFKKPAKRKARLAYKDITPPAGGKISIKNGKLTVPNNPIIPFIRGDGTGPDIWAASERVFDAAVKKAYGGKRKIAWFEVFAGEERSKTSSTTGCPTTPSRRSRNISSASKARSPRRSAAASARSTSRCARCSISTSACARCSISPACPRPVKHPEKVDMVIFRENTEDIYAGIDFEAGSEAALKTHRISQDEFPKDFKKIRFGERHPTSVGIGIKPVVEARHGAARPRGDQYAIDQKKKSVTIVHKGNIMKYTEGAFRDWGYELAKKEFGAVEIDGGPWCKLPEGRPGAGIVIKDAIADITLQQVLTRPTDFDVIATLNLNGDYLADALAAQVGGIGIAPGGNINYITGHAIFEATHGTAPKYANKDMVNPGSVVLSGEMMFRYLGWTEAADLILKGLNGAIGSKKVTYDFARQMEGATKIKCSEFGDNIIAHM